MTGPVLTAALLSAGPVVGLAVLVLWERVTGLSAAALPVLCMAILLWVQIVLIRRRSPATRPGPWHARRWLRWILGVEALMLAAFARPEDGMAPAAALGEMLAASLPALGMAGVALSQLGTGLLRRRRARRLILWRGIQTWWPILFAVTVWALENDWSLAYALWAGALMFGGAACFIWPCGVPGRAEPGMPRRAAILAEALSLSAVLTLVIAVINGPIQTWSELAAAQLGLLIGAGIVGFLTPVLLSSRMPAYRI